MIENMLLIIAKKIQNLSLYHKKIIIMNLLFAQIAKKFIKLLLFYANAIIAKRNIIQKYYLKIKI